MRPKGMEDLAAFSPREVNFREALKFSLNLFKNFDESSQRTMLLKMKRQNVPPDLVTLQVLKFRFFRIKTNDKGRCHILLELP